MKNRKILRKYVWLFYRTYYMQWKFKHFNLYIWYKSTKKKKTANIPVENVNSSRVWVFEHLPSESKTNFCTNDYPVLDFFRLKLLSTINKYVFGTNIHKTVPIYVKNCNILKVMSYFLPPIALLRFVFTLQSFNLDKL